MPAAPGSPRRSGGPRPERRRRCAATARDTAGSSSTLSRTGLPMASPVRRCCHRSASRPTLAPWAAVGAPPERTRGGGLLAGAGAVHGGFLGRGGPAVDALVPGQQAGLGVGRVTSVEVLESAGALVPDLVVEQLAVGVGGVAEPVALVALVLRELAGQPAAEALPGGLLPLRRAPVVDRPGTLGGRPAGVQDVRDAAGVVERVLRFEDAGGFLGIGAVRTVGAGFGARGLHGLLLFRAVVRDGRSRG